VSDELPADALHRVQRADGPVIADVHVPPSKSIVNRALVCAALAEGTSEITGIAPATTPPRWSGVSNSWAAASASAWMATTAWPT
jgi:hypothetical protein